VVQSLPVLGEVNEFLHILCATPIMVEKFSAYLEIYPGFAT